MIPTSVSDGGKLSPEAEAAFTDALAPGEAVRVAVRGTFGSALVATDRRVLIWKKRRLTEFRWENVADVAFGGGAVIRWVHVRGPSVGLVRPSLLNVGELADTIQLGEIVTDEARAVLAVLVGQQARGEPRDIEMGPAGAPGVRGAAPGDADDVLMEAAGTGGRLLLLRDRVRIRHTGFRGLFRKSLPAERELPFELIARVEWRSPGPLRIGRIGFRTFSGGKASVTDPEDTVMFYLHQEPAFREMKGVIERRLARRRVGPGWRPR